MACWMMKTLALLNLPQEKVSIVHFALQTIIINADSLYRSRAIIFCKGGVGNEAFVE